MSLETLLQEINEVDCKTTFKLYIYRLKLFKVKLKLTQKNKLL